MQLIPFNDTPNPGGEYKVWLISQAAGCVDRVSGAVITFKNSCAKTDNFKVGAADEPQVGIAGMKYRDVNRNGVKDDVGEEGLAGWSIRLWINDVEDMTQSPNTTDSDGRYQFTVPANAKVKVCEDQQTNWVQYGPVPGATVGPFTADATKCWATADVGAVNVTGLDFGNYNKVRLKGMKFYDTDNDGQKDDGEPGLGGWTIDLYLGTAVNPSASTTTGPGGGYEFEVEIGQTYRICEVLQAGYAQATTPTCWEGTVPGTDVENLNFGNNIRASGKKFLDANTNGQNDLEPGIEGFRIQISWCQESTCTTPAPVLAQTVHTDSDGNWSTVLPPPPATPTQAVWWYRVCEVLPPSSSWTQTAPASNCYIIQAGGEGTPGPTTGLDFGNYCRTTFGKTLGFWSNRNGQNVMGGMGMTTVLAELSALNLRNADGTHFDPATYTAFRNWILSATATNMANMLSAQMAATYLSAKAASAGNVMVWFGGDWVKVSDAIAAANALLSDGTCGTSCVVLSGNALRTQMEAYKNLFDAINNNMAVMAGCPVIYP